MIRLLALCLISLVGLTGCAGPAIETKNVSGYEVELLFVVDDCKVYRFTDNGSHHYFVTPAGETIAPRNKAPDERIRTR